MTATHDIAASAAASTPAAPDACPLCKGRDATLKFHINKHDVLRCRSCDLLYIHPYPADEAAVHQQVLNYDFDGLEVLDAGKQYRAEQHMYRIFAPRIEQEVAGATSVLDIGCGTGHLLERLARRFPGMLRAGIELNNARAALARRYAGCEIHQVPIERFEHVRRFDAILLINVLSHITSFDSLFAAIDRLISPRGKFIVQVGELSAEIRQDDIFDWGIPDHKHFLGVGSIEFMARRFGYRVARHERVPQSEELFRPERWAVVGRSPVRNMIKAVVRGVPGALPLMRRIYDLKHGVTMYSSFVVLTPD